MSDTENTFEAELDDLKKELEEFQQEKERIRAIIGKIGGVPRFYIRFFNTAFILILVVSVLISLFVHSNTVRLVMIELATVALSVKLLYMMHCQARVNHFQLWMQSSIEWRINEMFKMIREIRKHTNQQSSGQSQD